MLALSPNLDIVRRCQFMWGVMPALHEDTMNTLDLIEACAQAAVDAGLAEVGDKIGITAGLPAGTAGGTNLFKVHTIECETASRRTVPACARGRPPSSLSACAAARNARAFSTFPQDLHVAPLA